MSSKKLIWNFEGQALSLGRQNSCAGKYGKVIAVYTPRKTNMDTQNDGLENVTPFANMAHF